MNHPLLIRKAVAVAARLAGTVTVWVRNGYPPDAPKHGHVALLALCGTDLPAARIAVIADGLRSRHIDVTDTDIGEAIMTALDRLPRPSEIEQVRTALAR
jgi:hypothetical protein